MVEDAISRQRDRTPSSRSSLRLPGPVAEIGRQASFPRTSGGWRSCLEWLGLTEWQEVGGIWPPRVGGEGHLGWSSGEEVGMPAEASRLGFAIEVAQGQGDDKAILLQ